MKFLTTVILLLACLQADAQDCSKLVASKTMRVCQDSQYDLLTKGDTTWYLKNNEKIEKVLWGHGVEMSKTDKNGDEVEYQLSAVQEKNKLFISLDVMYPSFRCRMARTKNKYEILFSDGTTYRYHQPYLLTCANEYYILLGGAGREFHWHDMNKLDSVTTVQGDSLLLRKMLQVPIQKLTIFAAVEITSIMSDPARKKFGKYFLDEELVLSQQQGLKFMQTLQCLAKSK